MPCQQHSYWKGKLSYWYNIYWPISTV